MCGRYVVPKIEVLVRGMKRIRCDCNGEFKPRFNVPPTSQVPIIVKGEDGALELSGARWGLVPGWWRKAKPPGMTFNARTEDAAEKPTWRESLRSTRCLMPALGWFEWNASEPVLNETGREVKQPYFLFCPEAPVIAFAGMWSLWERAGFPPVLTCALLSKKAAPSIATIHPRMPVVLAPEQQTAWLDPAASADDIQQLIAMAREDLQGHPVSTRVNSVRNDSPTLMEKVARQGMDELDFGPA